MAKIAEIYGNAMLYQVSLIKTMECFRKPSNVAFCTTESQLIGMIQEAENLGKADRKSPLDIIKLLNAGF